MSDASQLDGKVAIVTGGSRGIGLAIATALMRHGATVMITARHEEDLKKAAGLIERSDLQPAAVGSPGGLQTATADVRDVDQVERLVRTTVEQCGGLDILINNAGVGHFRDVSDMTLEEWRQIIETNLSGVFHCCHAAIPHLRRRGGGWIINISSLAGKNSLPGGAAYCASKAGLNAFSESLMQEVRYDNIRVSYVMPGSVDTEFRGAGGGGSADWKLTADDVAQVVVDLLSHPARSLPSRVEIRPSRPKRA